MAFTSAEKVAIRRYCGYPAYGNTPVLNFAWRFNTQYGDLEFYMNNISSDEETVVRTVYLPNLATLEADIPATRGNIDTARAAVWYRNKDELKERWAIFDDWRRRLCGFLGVENGPFLASRTLRLVV